MGFPAKITTKGQTTVPQEVRDYLRLRTGDWIEFVIADGEVKLIAKNVSIADLAGFLGPPPRGAGATIEELDDAIGRAVGEDDERIKREWREGRE